MSTTYIYERRIHQDEWERNVVGTLSRYANERTNHPIHTMFYKALASALRVARDFRHDVTVAWNPQTNSFKLYGKRQHPPAGRNYVATPDGWVF